MNKSVPKKATISEIKKWFNLNNYDFIDELTIIELIREIEKRTSLFLLVWCADISDDLEIIKKSPRLTVQTEDNSAVNDIVERLSAGEMPLPAGTGVHPLSLNGLEALCRRAVTEKALSVDEENAFIVSNRNQGMRSVSKNSRLSPCEVVVEINLSSKTDEEIISSLKRLLPLWRTELNLPVAKMPGKDLAAIKKLVGYKIIPMLDLILWGACGGGDITAPTLNRLLFEGRENPRTVRRTMKEAALSIANDDKNSPIRAIRLSLVGNPLGSARIKDLGKL